MEIRVFKAKQAMAQAAAARASNSIRDAIAAKGQARIIAATGASQFEFLDVLTQLPGIDWSRVEMFHLDEYVGIPETHPASFRNYLRKRLIEKTGIRKFHLLDGTGDTGAAMQEVARALQAAPIDVAFVGIGENGHLAFNDPPADFAAPGSYIVVNLDEACRRQQLGEGWFPTLEDVPAQAISMTIAQILAAKEILAIVPDARKAAAVRACLEGPISPLAPASVLQNHPHTTIYLDEPSAAQLSAATKVVRS